MPYLLFSPLLILGGLVWWFPGLFMEAGLKAYRFLSGLKRETVIAGSRTWVYLTGGEGIPVVFVHGFGADKDRFGGFLAHARRSYRVYAPDLPGFGETPALPGDTFDIPSQTERLDQFVTALGLDTFHLFGVSMGGGIAADYAATYPQKVRRLVLMGAAGVASRIPSRAWRRFSEEGRNIFHYTSPAEFDELLHFMFRDPPWIPGRFKSVLIYRAMEAISLRDRILGDLLSGGLDFLEGCLERITAPTLLIWGEDDAIIHVSSVEKFHQGIRNCRTVIIPRCGHVPYFEKPRLTREVFRAFLEGEPLPVAEDAPSPASAR